MLIRGKRRDAEDIPIGSLVRTPRGILAKVIGYRGGGKDTRIRPGRSHVTRLVLEYVDRVDPRSRKFDIVQLPPDLVTLESLPMKEAA
jgi:hypothetical protein